MTNWTCWIPLAVHGYPQEPTNGCPLGTQDRASLGENGHFKGYIFVSCGCKFFLAYLTHTWPTWAPTVTPSLLVGVNREQTFLILGQFQKFQRQITYLVNFEYFLTNWTCSVLGVEQTNSTCMGSGMCASLGTLVPPSSLGSSQH